MTVVAANPISAISALKIKRFSDATSNADGETTSLSESDGEKHKVLFFSVGLEAKK